MLALAALQVGPAVALAAGFVINFTGQAAWAAYAIAAIPTFGIAAAVAACARRYVVTGSLIEIFIRAWRPGLGLSAALRRAYGLPLSFYGAAIAHMGVGLTLLGLAGAGFGAEAIVSLHQGAPQRVGPYEVTLLWVGERVGPNYKETAATMTVGSGGSTVAIIEPARRHFGARQMTTTQAGMATLDFGQVYVSIADPTPGGDVPARLYWKPLVTLIWLGGAAMALGGALSLADRRLRFGVATRAKAVAIAAAAE